MRVTSLCLTLAPAMIAFTWVAGAPKLAAQQVTAVKVTRLYTGMDGLSDFDQVEVPMQQRGAGGAQSTPMKMADSFIVRLQPGYFEDWHNADARRYVIPINGEAEVEIKGGQKMPIVPGQIWIAEDLTGKGHIFRVVGKEPWVGLFVNFAK